jgi:CheY-like chemotaxis protein/c-di-GMP-binding flagellar brake protein YcgR
MDTSPKHTVLLVDDEHNLVRVLEARLRREGYATLSAFDGAEALTVLRRHPVDVVVLDIQMGGLSGDETLKAMQAIRPGLPVVLMSAYGRPETLPDDVLYLEKPFNLEVLVGAVERALVSARRPATEPAVFALFNPGQPVSVTVLKNGDEICSGQGWTQSESEDAIEVDAPVCDGEALLAAAGSIVRVTLTGRDGLYTFNSTVVGSSEARKTLTVLKPQVIERRQRRAAPRRRVALVVDLQAIPPASGVPLRVPTLWHSVNVSEGGMMIAGDGALPRDSDLVFSMSLPGSEREIGGHARVVWNAIAPHRRPTYGLQFTSLTAGDRRRLSAYLRSLPLSAT